AEENLYSLVHAKRPHGGAPLRRRPPPFILTTPDLVITEEPFDLKALTEQPGGTSTRPAWGKWSYSGDDGVRAE
ncbi:MAG: hypothetical protein QOC71_20, partial [Thermoplasmata archaeon]|nr:hypothetical protein [Thermoplasmata archaeon]